MKKYRILNLGEKTIMDDILRIICDSKETDKI